MAESASCTSEFLTMDDLKKIIRETTPPQNDSKKKPSKESPGMFGYFVNRDFSMFAAVDAYNEVYPGIILGDQALARNKEDLKRLGVTHILNAAQGPKFNQIDTTEAYYADLPLTFMGINAQDVSRFKLTPYFKPASDFIEEAIKSGGKVAVHCHQGISRSATLVLAYLMTRQNMTATQAIQTIRKKRAIFPNEGFLKQIAQLHNGLYVQNPDVIHDSQSNNDMKSQPQNLES